MTTLTPILDHAKELVAQAIREGDVGVDATVGNGHDTLFLAQRVGATGHVHGFDVQAAARAATRARLQAAGLLARVTLHACGHERLAEVVPESVRVVMFNLGYLPGSDKRIVTRPVTTLPALDGAWRRLLPGGLITVVLYSGHAGGAEEGEAVRGWARALPASEARVLWYQFLHPRRPSPSLLAVEKR